MKILARVISVACVLVGLFLVSRTFLLEAKYTSSMPRDRDVSTDRTVAMTVGHDTRVFGTEAEARALDAAQTYFTFGWPFVILGVLLGAASRDHRIPTEAVPESDSPWTARR